MKIRSARVIPLLLLALVSLVVAAGVSAERRPFYCDMNLSSWALLSSLHKVEHYKATALVFSMAWLAVGNRRLRMAFVLTMLLGVAWEMAEATALGHTSRLSDLAPDFVAAFTSLLIAVLIRSLWFRHSLAKS